MKLQAHSNWKQWTVKNFTSKIVKNLKAVKRENNIQKNKKRFD